LAGNIKKSVQFLKRSFEEDEQDFDWMYTDKDLDPIRKEPEYVQLEKKYKDPAAIYFFDILRELSEQRSAFFLKKRISIVESNITRYSLEEMQSRIGLTLPVQPGDSVFNFSDKSLEFLGCTFENTNQDINVITNLSVKTLNIFKCNGLLRLSNLRLDNLLFFIGAEEDNHFKYLWLTNIHQHGVLKLYGNGTEFEIENSSFTIALPALGAIPLAQNNYVDMDDKDGFTCGLNYENINIYNSSFSVEDPQHKLAPFMMVMIARNLKMVNTSFAHTMKVRGSVSESLNIKLNKFPTVVDLFELRFPEFNCYMPFNQFDNSRFVNISILDHGVYQMAGDSAVDYSEASLVDNLTGFYKRLYDNYRSRADLTSSNHIYIRLKELEIAHLKTKPDKDLEDRMRLWLNQLMGFYTDHATSPGKAIIISFYIVLLFAIFYFFFPSEWDTTGKSQLIEDFKIFINKNEHGYVKPFFKMMKGFLLSFLNAITLSMNAFITLGFGSIPTTGLARYVCVFQGVLGWFLLSLFTVALLNQVLL